LDIKNSSARRASNGHRSLDVNLTPIIARKLKLKIQLDMVKYLFIVKKISVGYL